jgi:hypothetical protein
MEQEKKLNLDSTSNAELLDVLWQGLNKSSLKGVFTINESYLLKMVYDKLTEKITDKITDKIL